MSVAGKRIAVMQPYFFPYAGYFRLLDQVDEFVIFDCVQFPKSGRVHRTEVTGPSGATEWLTLPLTKQRLETRIADLEFSDDARALLDQRLARLPWFAEGCSMHAEALREYLMSKPMPSVVDFLEHGLRLVAAILGIDVCISRSSRLALDPALRGQDRVLAIVRRLGGNRYLNAPGGRALYDPAAFAAEGLELEFLPEYRGRYFQLLPALMTDDPLGIRKDMRGE